jgi:hypothetical protein
MAAFKNPRSGGGKTGAPMRLEEGDGGAPKPLSTAIMLELKNLKEKFKNDEEDQSRGESKLAFTL